MDSVLENVTKNQILEEPFPHLVIHNVLPTELYTNLAKEFPTLDIITQGRELSSNKRFNLSAKQILTLPNISLLWQEFTKKHTCQIFFNQYVALFRQHILKMYPFLEKRLGKLDELTVGTRGIDSFSKVDILLDAQIAINSPVFGEASSVRRLHVDYPNKLLTGLYYFRHPEDNSRGGDLEICQIKNDSFYKFNGASIDDQYVKVVKTIKYQPNTLVIFINSINSCHGVTVREITTFPRLFVNLVGEVQQDLFSLDKHQISRKKRIKAFFLDNIKKVVYG